MVQEEEDLSLSYKVRKSLTWEVMAAEMWKEEGVIDMSDLYHHQMENMVLKNPK